MAQIWLDNLEDPRLAPYHALKRSNLTRWSGLFIAEGEKVVRRLLASDFEIESVLASESHTAKWGAGITRDIDVYVLQDELARRLVGYSFHAGILACGRRRIVTTLSELPLPATTGHSVVVACDRITDPDNIGTVVRLCSAFGADALIVGPGCADPFSRRALRISMGNAFSLPMMESTDLHADLHGLQNGGYQLVATMLHPAAVPLQQARIGTRVAVLFGNEAHGLSVKWLDQADLAVVIPMQGETDSLNVSMAAAIILHYVTQLAGSSSS